ncbi:hypothetical protein FALBO_2044 [Fusarium albosuccineum]|uniref:Uncharacterized protein n=1 Tax=Fusarium albosuccineum TaxID=1237068 RepID=A0A8H4PFT0_9HYPO|nr:hypothetical protein FALBO_2044 [Fusarium albosuccineum]
MPSPIVALDPGIGRACKRCAAQPLLNPRFKSGCPAQPLQARAMRESNATRSTRAYWQKANGGAMNDLKPLSVSDSLELELERPRRIDSSPGYQRVSLASTSDRPDWN